MGCRDVVRGGSHDGRALTGGCVNADLSEQPCGFRRTGCPGGLIAPLSAVPQRAFSVVGTCTPAQGFPAGTGKSAAQHTESMNHRGAASDAIAA
jgi:hypothetical protein